MFNPFNSTNEGDFSKRLEPSCLKPYIVQTKVTLVQKIFMDNSLYCNKKNPHSGRYKFFNPMYFLRALSIK